MERNYVAKIALLAVFRFLEIRNSGFDKEQFLAILGESSLEPLGLYDKYVIKNVDRFVNALKAADNDNNAFFVLLGKEGISFKIGSYSFYLQNSPDFASLLTKYTQYSHVFTDLISNITLNDAGSYITLTYNFSREALKLSENSMAAIAEINFGSLSAHYNDMVSSNGLDLEFHSAHKHCLSDEDLSAILGHPFTSSSDGNYVKVPIGVKEEINPKYEADLPSMINHGLSKHLESQNSGSLVLIISNILESNPASSLDDISRQLLISKRTLQRRLQDQKINFTALKQKATNIRSIELLDAGNHSLEEIAKLLGYSSTATFVHAFSKWHSMSPTAYLNK